MNVMVNGITYDEGNPNGMQVLTNTIGCDSIVTINDGHFTVFTEMVESNDLLLEIFNLLGQLVESQFYSEIKELRQAIFLPNKG